MAIDTGDTVYVLVENDESGVQINRSVHQSDAEARTFAETYLSGDSTITWLDASVAGSDSAGYTTSGRKRYFHVEGHLLKD